LGWWRGVFAGVLRKMVRRLWCFDTTFTDAEKMPHFATIFSAVPEKQQQIPFGDDNQKDTAKPERHGESQKDTVKARKTR
jgi:hypothetical protein